MVVDNTRFNLAALDSLSRYKSLKHFELRNYSINKTDIWRVVGAKSVESLCLDLFEDSTDVSFLSSMTNLKNLNINGSNIKRIDFNGLSHLDSLAISSYGSPHDLATLDTLPTKHLPKLKKLEVNFMVSAKDQGRFFSKFPNLTSLDIHSLCKITLQGWRSIGTLTQLKYLSFVSSATKSPDVSTLFARLVNLETLWIKSCAATPSFTGDLAFLKNMKEFGMDFGSATTTSFDHLFKHMPKLTKLRVLPTLIADNVDFLKHLPDLEVLEVGLCSHDLLNDFCENFATYVRNLRSLCIYLPDDIAHFNQGIRLKVNLDRLSLALPSCMLYTGTVKNILIKDPTLGFFSTLNQVIEAQELMGIENMHIETGDLISLSDFAFVSHLPGLKVLSIVGSVSPLDFMALRLTYPNVSFHVRKYVRLTSNLKREFGRFPRLGY